MKKYFVFGHFFILFGLVFANQLLKDIIIYNKDFLLSNYKVINFDYQTSNLQGILPDGNGELIIGLDQYKLSLKNQLYHSKDNIWKKYIPDTNQLIIETANSTIDSIVLTILNYDFLLKNLNDFYNYNILSKKSDNLYLGNIIEDIDFSIDIILSADLINIDQVIIYDKNEILLDIYNIDISSLDTINIDTIQLNIKNPFILDLRE